MLLIQFLQNTLRPTDPLAPNTLFSCSLKLSFSRVYHKPKGINLYKRHQNMKTLMTKHIKGFEKSNKTV